MKRERLDCPYDFTSRCTMGRCDCKPKEELPIVNGSYGCVVETKKQEVNKMKQTAVEWLCKQYHLKQDIEIVKQAKEMEKEQIKDAYITGAINAYSKTSIDYYKETYETTL